MDVDGLLADAIGEKVALVPGSAFHPLGDGANTLRLNSGNASESLIEEGIARLGQVISRHLGPAAEAAR